MLALLRRLQPLLLDRIDDDATTTGLWLSYGRIGIGTAFLLAPRLLWGRQVKDRTGLENSILPLRMAGARDLTLGVGAVLAARRSSASMRGWLEAAALADGADAVLFSTNRTLRGAPRIASAAVAAGATYVGMRAARRLS